MIDIETLKKTEREFNPDGGDLGRGVLCSWADFEQLNEIPGYLQYSFPATYVSGDKFEQSCFPVYGCSGGISSRWAKYFIRVDNGKFFAVSVEANKL